MQPTQKIYDNEADVYDIFYAPMEHMFSKGRKLYSVLKGRILEIGVGTGNNLQYYNPDAEIYGIDWSPKMILQAKQKIKRQHLTNIKKLQTGDIQALSSMFPAHFFDYITSTCVLCSVPDPIKGLLEIKKVLKPTGKLVQMEHGLSDSSFLNLGIRFIDPFTYNMRGFHLARNHLANIKKAGFRVKKYRKIDPFGVVKLIISEPNKSVK